ncbi:helix-turn-helix domain containing protein [Paenibacillus urinalis]|uniref:Helix-turn-helix domain containing protein n=1 Tax=Paenibacillus urinalis TaxID=521520 RepID=A0ABY7XBC0_9BACL|nr:TetR/AcrR family transcriptional regulator [Paenibacillus urinalis]WDH99462.1 helix-turn-helix domain containing protein [Paenibacillus urinalis]WDI03096.1 helix-turn-helix domain containing protein [Paenibacillus urinalis]
MQTLKEEIKDRILAAALSEFEQYGYAQSSMRRIAGTAGITTGNIYRYFKNKDDLFHAVLEPTFVKFIKYTMDIKDAVDRTNTIDAFETLNCIQLVDDTLVELMKESSIEFKILLTLSQGSAYEQAKQDLIEIVAQILEKVMLIAKNITELHDPKDQLSVQMFATTMIEGICIILRDHEEGSTIKYLVDEQLYVFGEGFAKKLSR